MKFIVEKSKFESVLNKAAQAVNHGKGLPILANVRLEVLHEVLAVTAYDLEVAYEAAVDVKEPKAGAALVDAAKLAAVVRSLPAGDIMVEGTKTRVIVSSGSAEFRLSTQAVEEFPTVPTAGEGEIEVDAKVLAKALGAVVYAISTDSTRYTLNGVYLEAGAEGAVTVGTDGHRLAKAAFPWAGSAVYGSILPRKAVLLLKSMLEAASGPVKVALKDRLVAVDFEDETLSMRLIDGAYPRFQDIMPSNEAKGVWTVGRKALLDTLKRLAIVGVGTTVDFGARTLATQDPDLGEAKELLPGEYEGTDIRLGVNGGYVREALSAVSDETVTIRVWDDLSPVLITAGDVVALVMPMRI